MSSRFVLKTPDTQIAEIFNAELFDHFKPRFNIGPGVKIPVVRYDPLLRKRSIHCLHWGLVPAWAKDRKLEHNNFNARAETISELASFKAAYKQRRCLIPADGFYEWDRSKAIPAPYFFCMEEEEPFAFAGIWESWSAPGVDGVIETLESCCIVTTGANKLMAKIYNRMPVIVPLKNYDTWLDPMFLETSNFKTMLKPFTAQPMKAWPVSRGMTEGKNSKASCMKKIGEELGLQEIKKTQKPRRLFVPH
jgi:putative SOS response-associated peptidase YedK